MSRLHVAAACLFAALPLSEATASDADWAPVAGMPPLVNSVTLDDPAFYQMRPPLEQLRGRWIRISGRFQGEPGEARATVVAWAGGHRVSFSPPAMCRGASKDRTCEAFAWIPDGTDLVKMTVWSAVTPTTVSELRYEVGVAGQRSPEAAHRLDAALKSMAQLYYRSAEVDWNEIRRAVDPALAAPQGVDPVPGIVASVLNTLPGGRHNGMSLKQPHERPQPAEQLGQAGEVFMPSCRAIKGGVHLLELPGTPASGPKDEDRYIQTAQQCLLAQPERTRWVVDLRGCGGGSSNLTVAALAPLLPAGEIAQWKNGEGARIPVELTAAGLKTGGQFSLKHALPVGKRLSSPAMVWIGPGTASACEMLAAVLSTRPRTQLVGQPSAGLATGNETIEISADYSMYLTAGRLVVGGRTLDGDRLEPRHLMPPDVQEAKVAALFKGRSGSIQPRD